MTSFHQSTRFGSRLLVLINVVLVVAWGVLLVICVVKGRWLGVAANGLLLAMSWYSLRRAFRRDATQRQVV
ncbi:hypothetical protein [Blastococcus jejuensis]|uniref:hypothetical protein n=1 Tax=Blastococcus jejuensis TaxID=351224 RepID=UPI0031DDA0C6